MSTVTAWRDIVKYWKQVYYEPDLDTLRIVLSCICAHYMVNEDPVWLFIVAPSSAGKSSQILDPLESLDLVMNMDMINSKTFINGYEEKDVTVSVKGKGNVSTGNGGALFRLSGKQPKSHGIMTFSDFSVFTALKQDERATIQSQFRRIYDGKISHQVGNNRELTWEGKVSMIVAGTPEVAKITGNLSDVGDRFVKVNMGYPMSLRHRLAMQKQVVKNMGSMGVIREHQRKLIKRLIEGADLMRSGKGMAKDTTNFSYLVEFALLLRRTVIRDKRDRIVGIGKSENAGRIAAAAVQTARGSAMLDRRKSISEKDMKLAIKVIIDNIPEERWKVVRDVYAAGEDWIATDWGLASKYQGEIPYHGMMNVIDELEQMKVIECKSRRKGGKNGRLYRLLKLGKDVRYLMGKGFKSDELQSLWINESHSLLIGLKPGDHIILTREEKA